MSKMIKPTFNHDDVEILDTEWPHNGFLKLRKLCLRFRQFDGSMGAIIERELFTPPYEAVGVLLYDPKREKIGLVEQFRAGALGDPQSPWHFELVMGMVDDPDESLADVAIREAMEEAGAPITHLLPIYSFFNSPGTSSERMHLFCAEIDSNQLGGVFGLAAEHENIKVHVIDLAQAEAAIAAGELDNAATLIAIQWLLLNRKKIWPH